MRRAAPWVTFRRLMWRLASTFVLSVALLAACDGAPHDDSPAGAVRLFVAAMERSEGDRRGLEDAYHLLSLPTRERLVQRARDAAALGAREREPWEMLVEGTAHLRFTPRAGGYRERFDPATPDRATVVVRGTDGQEVQIPVVREDEGWRVELDVPAAPATEPLE